MAAPPNRTTPEGQIIDHHFIELQNKQYRAESAYLMLEQYNWNGNGGMPFTEWVCPTGNKFRFESGAGEIYFKDAPYSSLNSELKKEFFLYLPKFIVICLRNYDHNYNL